MPIRRLTLTNFRSYAEATIAPGAGFVVLTGDNGAGKTNILEAVSLFTPGRGLRGAALAEMARSDGPGGFGVATRLDDIALATGTLATAPERRQLRINAAPASINALSERLSVLWLTPAMDRLFSGNAGDRRRFLDRLVLALEPTHASHAARYEAAMRARNKLLADSDAADPAWLMALETAMVEHGDALGEARARTVTALGDAIASAIEVGFPRASLAIEGWADGNFAQRLRTNRGRDAAAGRAIEGPHRQDLAVEYFAKRQPAARASTGEQKALLLSIILAHAELVAERRGAAPILLLDEVAAHLDAGRRAALFARLDGRGQVWMSGTEASLFDGIGEASRFAVAGGSVGPA